jgi:hypothetical protein
VGVHRVEGISSSTGPIGLSSKACRVLWSPTQAKTGFNGHAVRWSSLAVLLCLIALKAVPAPEILSIWSGIFRTRDRHVGVGLAFCTNFHLTIYWVNLLRRGRQVRKQIEIPVSSPVIALAVLRRTLENSLRQERRLLGPHSGMMAVT